MKGPWKRYLNELWSKWHLLAVWEPPTEIALGDIGVMEDGVWRKVGDLSREGITFGISRDGSRSDRAYQSAGAVSIEAKVSAAAAGAPVEGSVEVGFSSEGAVLFNASGCEESRIADVGSLEEEIWARFGRNEWDAKHIVVTKVTDVERATILIASSKGGNASLRVKAKAGVDLAGLNLASASVSPEITASKDLLGSYVATDLTPLFDAVCIDRRGWLLKRGVGAATPKGGRLAPSEIEAGEPDGGVIAYRYEYEDYLEDGE